MPVRDLHFKSFAGVSVATALAVGSVANMRRACNKPRVDKIAVYIKNYLNGNGMIVLCNPENKPGQCQLVSTLYGQCQVAPIAIHSSAHRQAMLPPQLWEWVLSAGATWKWFQVAPWGTNGPGFQHFQPHWTNGKLMENWWTTGDHHKHWLKPSARQSPDCSVFALMISHELPSSGPPAAQPPD